MKRNAFILTHAVDARWFLELKRIKMPLLIRAFSVDIYKAKDDYLRFITNPKYNPEPFYPNLDLTLATDAYQELSVLRDSILQQEQEKSIRELYVQKIDEMQLELEMQQASARKEWDRFKELNEKRYGTLNTEIVAEMRNRLALRYQSFTPSREAAGSIAQLRTSITSERLHQIRGYLHAPQLKGLEPERVYEALEIQALWNEALQEEAPGWKSEVSDHHLVVCVNTRLRRLFIPAFLKVRGGKLQKLFAHEVGAHIRRRIHGKQSRLQLLSTGLPHYESSEEGLALLIEQSLKERFLDFGGHDKYLSLALATGAFDGQLRDFKETYAVLAEYFYERKKKAHSEETSRRLSQERAWSLAWRVFRGSDPSVPGACFLKDKIYREGNINVWRCILNDASILADAYLGKYDLCDDSQRSTAILFRQ